MILLVDPGQLAVRVDRPSISANAGQQVPLEVQVGRGQDISGPVTIELIVPEHMRGVSAKPLVMGAAKSSGVLQIVFDKGSLGPWNMPLTVRATATKNGYPYTAEDQLEVVGDRGKPPIPNPVAGAE